MKKFATLLALVSIVGVLFAGCSKSEDAGAAAPAPKAAEGEKK